MKETNTQQLIRTVCSDLADFLVEKNRSYGSSFSEPIGIFSKVSASDQLAIRIDDKINRLAKGNEYATDDTVLDLTGYLVLMMVLNRMETNE